MCQLSNLAKISITALLLTSISSQAHAQTAAVFKDATGAIYLYGLQPNSTVEVRATGSITKAVNANSCGLLVVNSLEIFAIDNQNINPASITDVRSLPGALNCSSMVNYPAVFKTQSGAIALRKSPNTPYAIAFPNHKTTRQVSVNPCGYAVLRNITAASLNLLAITGVRADFAIASFPQAKPLACVKGALYFPVGFNPKSAVASAIASGSIASTTPTIPTAPATSTTSTTTVSAQTAQPQAAKSGTKLIISSIPPGTYAIANAANLQQKKTYTVTSKACLVAERTQLGNATNFLVSRQGLTFPVSWGTLLEIPAAAVPTC